MIKFPESKGWEPNAIWCGLKYRGSIVEIKDDQHGIHHRFTASYNNMIKFGLL